MSLPTFLQSYFWDIDFKQLDFRKYRQFVLARILEYGDKKALKWAAAKFPTKDWRDTLIQSKNLTPKTANFWAIILGIDKNKIPCLKKFFQKKQSRIWPY